MKRVLTSMVAAAVWFLLTPAHSAERTTVDLELILMADASGSVDTDEFQLQRRGTAAALRDPRIINAIQFGRRGRIALSYVEWSGPELQEVIVPWSLIESAGDLHRFAKRLEETPRQLFGGGTAIGNALLYGAKSIETNAFIGDRRVIDLSGDDRDIDGLPAVVGRDRVVARGITINGLPVLEWAYGLDEFFRDHVIGGPGAFYVPAVEFKDFQLAFRKKLIREIAGGAHEERAGRR